VKAIRHPILTIAGIVILFFSPGLTATLYWVVGLFLLSFCIASLFGTCLGRALATGFAIFIFIRFGWIAAFGFILLAIGVPPPRVRQSDKQTEALTKPDASLTANQPPVQASPHKLLDQPALPNNLGRGLNERYEKSEKQVDERDRFDAFTERARKVLSLAQEEAQRFQHNYIGTEHLLLGLVHEGKGVAAKVLSNLGVELNKIRSAVEFVISRGDHVVPGAIGLTPHAKRVIELAVNEARRLNQTYIGTEHLLLGLMLEGEGIAAWVLESLGVNLEDARVQTMKVLEGYETLSQPEQQESVPRASPDRPELRPLIRLFISSTFHDFVFEREVLQRAVFPRLRALCAAQGCRFQPIDLRWGVSKEAGNEKRTLTICLDEVARCQQFSPDLNFLILLGDRYGSSLLPERIPSDQVARLLPHLTKALHEQFIQAYKEDHNALQPEYVLLSSTGTEDARQEEGESLRVALAQAAQIAGFSEQERLPFIASATHLEVQRGLLDASCDPTATICAFRSFTSVPEGPQSVLYVEQQPERRAYLEAFKTTVERRLDGHVHRYGMPGEITGLLHTDLAAQAYYKTLTEQFYALLEPRIQEALARRHADARRRDPVVEANRQFAAARASVVVGRDNALAKVAAYLTGQTLHPLVVTGDSGVGKSTLLARAVDDATQAHPHAVVVTRYIGVTPGTSGLTDLLSGLRREIAVRYGQPVPEPLGELSQLVFAVADQLRTQAVPAERPLFLVIDALDQLSTQSQRQRVDWVPSTLAANVRIVVSTLSDRQELVTLRTWLPAEQILQLDPLTRAQGASVLRQWLAVERRWLTDEQAEAVLDGFAPASVSTEGTGTPLYLRLAFEQARTWRSFDPVDPLPPTISSLMQRYFERLEALGQHGRELVAYALGYLTAAKHGLAEDELLDLLARSETVRNALHELNPGSPPIEAQQPLPMALWARLLADLERYLTEREVDGARLVAFYHQQVREEAERRYLGGTERPARHADLATYFGRQPYWLNADGAGVWNRRKLAELAYQQAETGPEAHQALETTLTDGHFLEGKLAVEGVTSTLDDLKRGFKDKDVAKIASVIRAGTPVLTREPSELTNQITGRVGHIARLHHQPERTRPWLRLRTQSLLPPDPSLLGILLGHTDSVVSCALSADGHLALSASKDKTVRLWDTTTGECLRIFEGHTSEVNSCALSKDGHLALSASKDKTVRLWDTTTGECLHIFKSHTSEVNSCALSKDGHLALSASNNETETLCVWNTTTGQLLHGWRFRTDIGARCALSADGSQALFIWVNVLPLFTKYASPLYLWDCSSDQPPRRLGHHTNDVKDCALSVDGQRALFASSDCTLLLWDTSVGKCLRVFEGHTSGVSSCALSEDGRLALSASWDKTLRLWDTTAIGQSSRDFRVKPISVNFKTESYCALSEDGHLALSVTPDQRLRLWDTATVQSSRVLESSSIRRVTDCALSADGRRALSASWDKNKILPFWHTPTLRLWDTATGKCLRVFKGHNDEIKDCALSADGRRALSTSSELTLFHISSNGTLRLWDTDTGKCLSVFRGHTSLVSGCTLSADGGLALSASLDKTLRLWDTASGKCLLVLEGHHSYLTDCALSADGRRALSASWDKTLRLWDTASGKCLLILEGHTLLVHSCALSADGRRALSASWDKTLRLWNTTSGQEIARWIYDGSIRSCALDANGRLAMVGEGGESPHFLDGGGRSPHFLDVVA
jgi:WD40 repeat protein